MDLSEDWQDVFDEIGEPDEHHQIQISELDIFRNRLPSDLVYFFENFGRAAFLKGQLQVCTPTDLKGVLALIFKGDADFDHKECHAYAFSVFGRIFFWHEKYGSATVDLISGRLRCRNLTKKKVKSARFERGFISAFSARKDAYEFYDLQDKPLFARARRKLGEIGIGECYGFVPALGLGGVPELEKLKKLKAPEHFTILAQLIDFQLIDVQGYGKSVVVREIG